MPYASRTKVPANRTKVEIEDLLQGRGARRSGIATEPGAVVVMFELADRLVRFRMPMPVPPERMTPSVQERHDRAIRERWRALGLCIKTKFVAIDSGVETFEQAFLAHIVVPEDNRTIWERFGTDLALAYKGGRPMPFLLGSGTERD